MYHSQHEYWLTRFGHKLFLRLKTSGARRWGDSTRSVPLALWWWGHLVLLSERSVVGMSLVRNRWCPFDSNHCGDFGSRSWISPGWKVMLSSKLFPDYPGRVASAILGQRERMKRRTWFQSNRTLIFQCGASGFYTCHKGPALKANTALPVTCRQKQSNKNCRPPAVTRSRRRGQPNSKIAWAKNNGTSENFQFIQTDLINLKHFAARFRLMAVCILNGKKRKSYWASTCIIQLVFRLSVTSKWRFKVKKV